MTHCVPDWDGHGGELDAIIATTDHLPPVKEKQTSDVPSGWTENGPVGPKPEGHGAKSPDWQVNCNTWTTVREGTVDAITPSKPPTSEPPPPPVSNGVLAVNVPVLDPTMSNSMMADDEMVSWLRYPLDDTLEKSYCSDFFGELPNSTDNTMQAIKDSLAVGQHMAAAGRPNCRNLPTVPGGMNGSLNRVVSADAAMAMGAGRAAGVLPQAGVEVFTKVRTQQPYSGKWSPNTSTAANPAKTVAASAVHTSTSPTQQHQLQQQPLRASMVGVTTSGIPNITSSMLLPPPKPQLGPLQFAVQKKGTMNFSHFSVPAVNMKASLQCLGMSHGGAPAQNRLKGPYHLPNMPNSSGTRPFDATTSSGSSIAESTMTRLHSEVVSRNDTDVRGVEGSPDGGQQPSLATDSSWPSSLPNSLSTKEAEVAANSTAGTHVEFESSPADQQKAKPAETETRQNSYDRSNAAATPSTDAAVTPPQQIPEPPEATLTSSSGGSGNTSKGVAGNRGKRRTRDQEESEIQSDDAEDEVVELKKPQQRTNPSKRTRAAEVHNLSERRRRDRINEKMKALQELIPNSNKADKASMLDEAIEYLKMLQIQLQMMSMRSGMSIPSLIPNGMQQVSQMGGMAPMGMGLGMMGIGPMVGIAGMGPMGHMLDMNSMAAAGRTSHLIPHLSHGHGGAPSHTGSPMMPHHQMPAHGGASYNVSQVMPHHPSHGGSSHTTVSATSPAVSMVDSQDLRLQSNSASALESVYLARQHPLQLTPQTMDVYNAYMIHQQQQHQYQHQQQQQQQHQLHHLPSNMAGGGLQ